jgi:hypothetical protein
LASTPELHAHEGQCAVEVVDDLEGSAENGSSVRTLALADGDCRSASSGY